MELPTPNLPTENQSELTQLINRYAERDDARLRLLSLVTHELSTPMATIKGYLEMLEMNMAGELNSQQQKFIRAALQSTTKLEQIIRDIDSLAKLEANRIEFVIESFNLSTVIYETVRVLYDKLQKGQLSLNITISQTLPQVEADKIRVGQILTNLLSNAIKYTPPGGQLTIQAEQIESWVQVNVQDSGVGIKESDLAKLFQPFFRSDHPFIRGKTGTGLGLSIAKLLIERQNGLIWVDSQPEKGSTFYFTLPIARDLENHHANPN